MATVQAVDLHRSSDDFKATPEEIATISKKMEDPEFRKLWVEYMQSLADPVYRQEEEA